MRWTLVAIAVSVFTSGTSLASNATPPSLPSPWYPIHTGQNKDRLAGDACAFALAERVVDDQEMARTLAVDASGKPTVTEIKGDLIMRYTNVDTGKSVVRHVDGHAFISVHPDESETWVIDGPFAGAVSRGSQVTFVPRLGLGSYIWSGVTVLDVPPYTPPVSKPPTLTWAGPVENLCDTLSDDP